MTRLSPLRAAEDLQNVYWKLLCSFVIFPTNLNLTNAEARNTETSILPIFLILMRSESEPEPKKLFVQETELPQNGAAPQHCYFFLVNLVAKLPKV
jgi:hypothetical protein